MPTLGIKRKQSKIKLYYPKKNNSNAIKIMRILANDNRISTQELAEDLGKLWHYPHKRVRILMESLMEFGYCHAYDLVVSSDYFCEHCKKSKKFFVGVDDLKGALSTLENNKKQREIAKKENRYKSKEWFHCNDGYVLGRLVWLICFNCGKHCEQYNKDNDGDQFKIQRYRYWSLTENGRLTTLGLLKGNTLYKYIKNNTDNKIIELVNVLLRSQKKELVDRLIKSIQNTMNFKPNVDDVVKSWYDEMKLKVFYLDVDSEQFPILSDYKERNRYSMLFRHGDMLNKSVKEQDW